MESSYLRVRSDVPGKDVSVVMFTNSITGSTEVKVFTLETAPSDAGYTLLITRVTYHILMTYTCVSTCKYNYLTT